MLTSASAKWARVMSGQRCCWCRCRSDDALLLPFNAAECSSLLKRFRAKPLRGCSFASSDERPPVAFAIDCCIVSGAVAKKMRLTASSLNFHSTIFAKWTQWPNSCSVMP
jgi:hypothetical protein